MQYELSKLRYIVASIAFSGEVEIPGFVLWKPLQPVYYKSIVIVCGAVVAGVVIVGGCVRV